MGADDSPLSLQISRRRPEAAALQSTEVIIADMLARVAETAEMLESIRGML